MRHAACGVPRATGIVGENAAHWAEFSPTRFVPPTDAVMQRIVKRVDKRTILL